MSLRPVLSPLLRVLIAGALVWSGQDAHANQIDVAMLDFNTRACQWMLDIESSLLMSVIAVVMFSAGGFMLWLRIRGGLELLATGLIGYFLHSNTLAIASAFGLDGCG